MVVDDSSEAARLAGEGRNVVLVVGEGGPPVRLDVTAPGRGRVAVFVGSRDEPAVWAAARAMSEELFGPD
jgi:hypothetical protein